MGEIRLYLFEGGSIYLPLRNTRLGEGGDDDMITTPVLFAVLTHPRGNVVFDGGNAPEVAVDAKKHWGAITEMSTAIMSPEQALLPSLERVGIAREHPLDRAGPPALDHTGALAVIDRLPSAEVLVTRTEWEWAYATPGWNALAYCRQDYVKPGIPWVLLDDSDDGWDVFGDGVLRCWRTPGHSPGHMSFEIALPSGNVVLLTFDAANTIDHLEERALPGFIISMPETIASVRKLRRLAWRSQALVIAGHDPDQWPELRKAPEYYD